MQLRVIKADGSIEEYLHTKIVGTINRAIGETGEGDISIAEQLSEVVTYFLYHRQKPRVVSSSEIFSIIMAVLSGTGYEDAALCLSEHYYQRKLKRLRIEVVSIHIEHLADAEKISRNDGFQARSRWDKSKIVDDLMKKHNLFRQTARTIASMVEEKVFQMGLTIVPASLIKQLVLGDAAAVLSAEEYLRTEEQLQPV